MTENEIRADERARCAAMLTLSNAELLLLAGEMTAQELRTVQAVLRNRANFILTRDKGHENE